MINEYPNGVIAQLLQAIIGQINFDGTPTSNIGDILLSILEQTPYDKEPKSVLAELFLKLKDKLEGRAFTPYDKEPKSAIAEILLSILNETEYDKEPNSRIAELLLELKAELESYVELTASGAIANFTTSVVKPLVNLTAYFKATQEAGAPTPQSPKAISGVSAVNVVHSGNNIYNYDENKVKVGETTAQAQRAYYDLGVENCTLSFNAIWKTGVTPPNSRLNISKLANGQISALFTFVAVGEITPRHLTFAKGERAILSVTVDTPQTLKDTLNALDIQIEVGTNEGSYEPYNGSTTLINLGGTYYGGYVSQDKNGKRELVVTKGVTTLGELTNWRYAQGSGVWRFQAKMPNDYKLPETISERLDFVCSCFTPDLSPTTGGSVDNSIAGYTNDTKIYILCNSYTDLETFLTALSSQMLVYPLAEPFTVALPDGEPITAFNGVNNIYNDSGDTSVTYLAKIADNLNATAKLRAEVKAQKIKEKEELKEDVKELEPIMDSGETKRGA